MCKRVYAVESRICEKMPVQMQNSIYIVCLKKVPITETCVHLWIHTRQKERASYMSESIGYWNNLRMHATG